VCSHLLVSFFQCGELLKRMVKASQSGSAGNFCEAATVPPSKAAAFGRWASTLVGKPAASKLHEYITLRMDNSLGTHLLAAKRFDVGELIISEAGIIRIPDLSREERGSLHTRFGDRAAFLAPAVCVDWAKVDDDKKHALLDLFWAHPLFRSADSALLKDNMPPCQKLIEVNPTLQSRWDAQSLAQFLHVVDLNIHRDDEVAEHASFAGLFVLGSKFSHSCAPNCRWSFSDNGELQYHAIRNIEPGELLTFSYVGNGMNLVVSTMDRRQRLATLWFVCKCSRCTGPDLSRQMICPKCGAARCIPVYEAGDSGMNWKGDRPLRDLLPEAQRWLCTACNASSSSSDMPLQVEAELGRQVPQVMMRSPDAAAEDMHVAAKLQDKAARVLGTNHWCWVLATFAWLQKCLIQLQHSPVVQLSTRSLKQGCVAVAEWFEEQAPHNVEQRLSALCLAARCACHLGKNGLLEWGYNPADPLGDGSIRVKQLEAGGWKLQGSDVHGPLDSIGGAAPPICEPLPVALAGRRYCSAWQ